MVCTKVSTPSVNVAEPENSWVFPFWFTFQENDLSGFTDNVIVVSGEGWARPGAVERRSRGRSDVDLSSGRGRGGRSRGCG